MSEVPSPGARALRALAFLVGTALVAEVARSFLASRGVAGDIAAAIVVDLGASRAGVAWHDGKRPYPDAARGLALGGGAVLAALAVAIAAGLATASPRGPSWMVLFSLLASAAFAVRTEVLFRWMPHRLLGAFRGKMAILALFSAAPHVVDQRWDAAAVGLAMGALSVVLLEVTGSPVAGIAAAFGAHAAAGVVAPGILGVRFADGSVVPFDKPLGVAAWCLAAALGLAAVAGRLWLGRASPGSPHFPDTTQPVDPPS